MPMGLFLLALFGAVIGVVGIASEMGTWFSSDHADESLSEMLERVEGELTPEQKDAVATFRQSPELLERIEELMESVKSLVPMPGVYRTANFLFAIVALAAAVGMFKRKDWGRKLEIGFIIAATLFAALYGYLMIPGFGRLTVEFAKAMGASRMAETGNLERNLYLGWTAIVLLFAVLHAGIVWYLTRTNIRDVFEENENS